MLDIRTVPASAEAEPVPGAATPAAARVAAANLARSRHGERVLVDASSLSAARLTAFAEGLVLGGYRFSLRSGDEEEGAVELAGVGDADALARGLGDARAVCWARDLANTPAGTKTPDWLAATARRELTRHGVEVDVRDEQWLAVQGFGGVLAVGGGSAAPPRLIEARWRPPRATARTHVVLVGKGITFDTGGINLKPGDSMRTMHTDMSGGAAVLGAIRRVAELRLPVRVTALVPAAENAFSGAAFRPSDVIRHVGGRTSEIGNTDAEGRLVLADALAYAVQQLRPTVLVDLATLTGAMKVALGLRTAGLFATDDRLARALGRAGDAAGEPVWRMPLHADYAATLRSEIADANNSPGNPGAITAALFLQPFTGALPWAHLDIAGPARAAKDDGVLGRGATGFGVRLLVRWLESLA